VVWAPGGAEVVFVGWEHNSTNFNVPQMLGMLYCFNRPSALYAAPAPAANHSTQVLYIWEVTTGP
jgi:acylaminoacyl-peptidase